MSSTVALIRQPDVSQSDADTRLAALLPEIAANADHHDGNDEFVAGNYAALKAARLMSAAVPQELGGDGLDATALSPLLRALARSCSSTALSFAMHTHVAAFLAWRWRHQKAPVDAVLKRIVAEQIVLVSSGGSDWLDSSGIARRAEGGFVIDAIKGFASGVQAGSVLNTSAVYDDPQAGPTVLHFMVPLNSPHVTIEPNWRALGMRGTGSHQVRIAGFFVADAAVAARRPRGQWHPLFHMISMIAFPIIYSVYYGVGEALRDAAVATARRRPATPALVQSVGALETELAAARFALTDMLAATGGQPGPETTNRVFLGRSNIVRALTGVADKALEVTQGSGYLRQGPVERLFRDIQAARFHPLPTHAQETLAGRVAMGLDIDG